MPDPTLAQEIAGPGVVLIHHGQRIAAQLWLILRRERHERLDVEGVPPGRARPSAVTPLAGAAVCPDTPVPAARARHAPAASPESSRARRSRSESAPATVAGARSGTLSALRPCLIPAAARGQNSRRRHPSWWLQSVCHASERASTSAVSACRNGGRSEWCARLSRRYRAQRAHVGAEAR